MHMLTALEVAQYLSSWTAGSNESPPRCVPIRSSRQLKWFEKHEVLVSRGHIAILGIDRRESKAEGGFLREQLHLCLSSTRIGVPAISLPKHQKHQQIRRTKAGAFVLASILGRDELRHRVLRK